MSTLETFVLQFEAKGSKMVLADIQQISEKTRKLESLIQKETKATEDNTKKEEQSTKARQKQTNQMTKQNRELWTLTKRLIGLGSIYAVLRKGWSLGINFMQQGQGIRFMANSANMATGAFQKWAAVAKKFGGNENSVTSTMMGISSQIEEMRFGQVPMQEVAARYGISLPTTKDPEKFLLHLAKSLEGRRPEEQRQIGRQMGFGEDIIRMLQLGYSGLSAELGNAQVKLNNAQLEKADQLNKAMEEVKEQFSAIALNLGSDLAPMILEISKMFAGLSAVVSPIIAGFFKIINESKFLQGIGEALASDDPLGALFGETFGHPLKTIGKGVSSAAKSTFGGTAWWLNNQKTFSDAFDVLSLNKGMPQLTNGAANIIIQNENYIDVRGREMNENLIAREIGIKTTESAQDISNIIAPEQK